MQQLTSTTQPSIDPVSRDQALRGFLRPHAQRVSDDLKRLGADRYDMLLPESKFLPFVVNAHEQLDGIVYGRYVLRAFGEETVGRGVLVTTADRLLFLDKKPLYARLQQIPYDKVSAVSYARVGFGGTVTVHTKVGDFMMRTFNQRCARGLVQSLERKLYGQGREETAI